MKDFKIVKSGECNYGACYTLVLDDEVITSHFCSSDGFAYGDLYGHKETKEHLSEDDTLEQFSRIPIV